jgi:amidase
VWVTPTVAIPAPKIGTLSRLPPAELIEAAGPIAGFTAVFNASGQPAVSIPVWVEGAPPVGVQIVGRHNEDKMLLALSRQVMDALGTPVAPIAPVD